MANLNFKWGNHANLPAQLSTDQIGSLFFTKDEGALYLGVEAGKKPQRIQGVVQYYADLAAFKADVLPPYSEDVIYYIASENALVKWHGAKVSTDGTIKEEGKFTILNVTASEFNSTVTALSTDIAGNASNIAVVNSTVGTLAADLGEKGAAAGDTTAFARIKQLENAVKELEELTGTDSSGNSLSARITALETWQTTASSDIAGLKTDVAGHTTTIGSHTTKINALETFKTSTESDLTNIKTNISNLQGEDTIIKTRLTTAETGLSTANEKIIQLTTDLSGLASRVGTNETNITNLQGNLSTVNDKINDLEGWKDTTSSTIANHTSSINTINGKITSINGQISTINGDIAGLSQTTSKLRTDLGTNDKTDGSTAFTRIKALENANSEANTAATQLTNRVNTLESAVTGLDTRLDTAEEDVKQLKTDVAANAKSIGDLVTNLDTNYYTKTEANGLHTNLKTELENKLTSHINAANALVYIGGVGSVSEWNTIKAKDAMIGHTYVVTSSGLVLNINGTDEVCYAGDLLIATAANPADEVNNVLPANKVQWVVVEAGYNEELATTMRVVDGDGADTHKKASIQLSSYTGAAAGNHGDLGKVHIVSASNNLNVDVNGENISITMVWGEF